MDITRNPDWRTALLVYIEENRNIPHEWGVSDCALFAAGAVQVMTGVDFATDFIGRYANKKEALAVLKKEGGMAGLVTQRLGEPVAVLQARFGDVLMGESERGEHLAVCVGVDAVLPVTKETGEPGNYLDFRPLDQFLRAWHVG